MHLVLLGFSTSFNIISTQPSDRSNKHSNMNNGSWKLVFRLILHLHSYLKPFLLPFIAHSILVSGLVDSNFGMMSKTGTTKLVEFHVPGPLPHHDLVSQVQTVKR